MEQSNPLADYRARQEPPLSQSQLADFLGVSRAAISRWEAGMRRIDENRVAKITALTGIPARELRPDLANLMDEAAA